MRPESDDGPTGARGRAIQEHSESSRFDCAHAAAAHECRTTLITKAARMGFHLSAEADNAWMLSRWNLSKSLPDDAAVLEFSPVLEATVRRAFTEALNRRLWAAAYVAEESRERNALQRRYVRSAAWCLVLALLAGVGAE